MCGIAGLLHRDGAPVSPVRITAMTDAIAHRGPDGEGQVVLGAVGLGHRRLSIIDPSPLGRQPMVSPDGRYYLSFNGEIYNFQELKASLVARGHQFVSRTDSEVLLKAFVEWGVDMLPRLNGMFAFAIWDAKTGTLTLARDRFGVKPLYYACVGSTVVFASEIKALFASGELDRSLDPSGLIEYLSFQNFFTDRTLFSHVRLLPQGTYLQVRMGFEALKSPTTYWDFDFQEPEGPFDINEATEELARLFDQAVKRQLVADVEVGSYLSGGIDSGSITAIASQSLPNLRTFTVGFDLSSASGLEMGFDERAASEHLSYLFQTEHYEMVLKAGDMSRVMPRLTHHLEEPRVGQCYPNFYAAQLASKFVKVCLSGVGGDEVFAGYPWRYYRAVEAENFDQYVNHYFEFWQRLVPAGSFRNLIAPIADHLKEAEPLEIFRGVFGDRREGVHRPEDYINHSLYFEAKTFLNGLLVVEDKLSMAHSLETRVPFLDNDLVDFAMRLPAHAKLGNLTEVLRLNENEQGDKKQKYFEKTRDGKLILRDMMRRHIPDVVADRIKQGFSAPDASWFKGESIGYVRDRLFRKSARIYDVLDEATVHSLVEDHLSGRENRRLLIWSLLYLEQTFEDQFESIDLPA